jgi:hypothetical protein
MAHPTIFSTAFAAAWLSFLAPVALAADPAPPPNMNRYGQTIDLRAELSTEAETSFRGDWHHRILIANYGPTQLIYRGIVPGWGITYVVTDVEGRPVRPAEPFYTPPPGPPPQSMEVYLSLSLYEFYGHIVHTGMPIRQLVPGPGTYRVVARIRSPVPASLAPSEDVWTSDRTPIDSNPVTVTVAP